MGCFQVVSMCLALLACLETAGSWSATAIRSTGRDRSGGRRRPGWCPSESSLVVDTQPGAFPLTARELVDMGRYPHLGPLKAESPAVRQAVDDAMGPCDVADLAHRAIQTLSGGELQRVRIARALAQAPRALVLDEPTASLDVRHEMTILGLLRELTNRGSTVLFITHHLNLAGRYADRMLLLSEGTVAAEGSPEDVLRADVLERVYRWPVVVETDPVSRTPRVTPLDAPPTPTPP